MGELNVSALAKVVDREAWERALQAHLRSLHCANWGRSMPISQPEERAQAAAHLYASLIEPALMRVIEEKACNGSLDRVKRWMTLEQ